MTTRRPEVLVVQNSPTSGGGRLPAWLEAAEISPTYVAGEDLGPSLDGVDGIVLLGGGFMPDDDERSPWLAKERRLVVQALKAEVPLLGICLGAQLLAICAGGEVTEKSGETERGSCPVTLLPAAADDPVFAGLVTYGELRMIQNHEDSVTVLPPGADHLATSDRCTVQAFRVGMSAWGVQFHPEVGADRLRSWDEAALRADGYDRAALIAGAEEDAERNEEQSRTLIAAFARVVHDVTAHKEVG
ncbi:type 1 glutamine amidotransferase [Mumia quercus]|uniref:type 1 glutamine amidotransferase n=1 Tax=Mumia quercus TaxID=2976125 RepID=UPI0021D1E445|nr:type 1 glutamine amidotransferase [Mumia quercus]